MYVVSPLNPPLNNRKYNILYVITLGRDTNWLHVFVSLLDSNLQICEQLLLQNTITYK